MSPILCDIETAPLPEATAYFDPSLLHGIKAPSNWRDPDKIADYVAETRARLVAEHAEKAALDPDLCRIVAIGWWIEEMADPTVLVCRDETDERSALDLLWLTRRDGRPRPIVGYNIVGFDLPVLYRRSLYLGVPTPSMRRGKWSYQNPEVEDLFLRLSEDGRLPWRSASWYARRFGLDVPHDPYSGADVPRLVAEGQWDDVRRHCLCDLLIERALAVRLGVMRSAPTPLTTAAISTTDA